MYHCRGNCSWTPMQWGSWSSQNTGSGPSGHIWSQMGFNKVEKKIFFFYCIKCSAYLVLNTYVGFWNWTSVFSLDCSNSPATIFLALSHRPIHMCGCHMITASAFYFCAVKIYLSLWFRCPPMPMPGITTCFTIQMVHCNTAFKGIILYIA